MKKEVLIIDENQGSDGLERFLKTKNCFPVVVDNVEAGLEKIKKSENLKVVLLNVESSERNGNGLEALKRIKTECEDTIVIVIRAGVNTARQALKRGALDVMSKNVDMESIYTALDQAFGRLSTVIKRLPIPEGDEEKTTTDEWSFIGESEPMFKLNKEIGRVANNELSVLIEGETGTGKELVANLIHKESKRSENEFVSIDCGALTNSILEAELFGSTKGAFTDAIAKHGRIEEAAGGTLFLDEVGNMPTELQKKLLNVLQTKKVTRVGGTKQYKVDVRVVSATNKNLREMVDKGEFRGDLFYRLRGCKIAVPPLRERIEDIPLLVSYFLERIKKKSEKNGENGEKKSEKNGENRRPIYDISENAMRLLQTYHWPGNVRELENCVERATLNSQGSVILERDLSRPLRRLSGDQESEESLPHIQSSETPEMPIYKNLLDLPVGAFCQMLSDGRSDITGRQITEWWKEFSDDGRALANEAKLEIDNWLGDWNAGWLTDEQLPAHIQAVVDKAVSVLSDLRDEEGSKLVTEVKPISIKGRTLKGSLAAVLDEIVNKHGGKKKKAAKELGIKLERLERQLSDSIEDDENDTTDSRSTSMQHPIELCPKTVVDSLLIEPIKLFVLEPFSRIEWQDKAQDDQLQIIHLDLKVLSKRLGGDHSYIYFGGMTFSQIERSIYRQASDIYANPTEAAKALKVDLRTCNRYWVEDKKFPGEHTLLEG